MPEHFEIYIMYKMAPYKYSFFPFLFTSLAVWVRCIVIHISTHLYVHSHISIETTHLNVTKFSVYVYYLSPRLCPPLMTMHYIMYFQFCGRPYVFTQWSNSFTDIREAEESSGEKSVEFWAARCTPHNPLASRAEDLNLAPASQAFVESIFIFSLCGLLTAEEEIILVKHQR